MPLRSNRSGKPILRVALFVTSLACFWPAYAHSPTVHRTLGPGVARPSARTIAQRGMMQLPQPKATKRVASAKTHPVAKPVQLTIPTADIDANVLELGLLKGGKLDAPKDGKDLGWYKLGPKPGEKGNAVIDGHLDTSAGPGAFWNLKNVKVGDMVSVTDENGITRVFKVRKTQVYHVNNAPMQEIFGDASGNHLNLITCAGVWDTSMDHYDKRLIVYTDLVVENTPKTAKR